MEQSLAAVKAELTLTVQHADGGVTHHSSTGVDVEEDSPSAQEAAVQTYKHLVGSGQ